jgi:hypothetical protein
MFPSPGRLGDRNIFDEHGEQRGRAPFSWGRSKVSAYVMAQGAHRVEDAEYASPGAVSREFDTCILHTREGIQQSPVISPP